MTQAILTTAKWTIDEYHRLIDQGFLDDKHVELLNGEIVEMAPEGIPHASLTSETVEYLRELLRNRAKVRESHPITLPDHSEPEPDIAIVQHPSSIYREHHPYPENILWLIEFSDSSLAKDLQVKTKIYGAAGIQEYWVINLKVMTLIVFRLPSSEGYQSEQTFTQGTINPLAFSDVVVSIANLLR